MSNNFDKIECLRSDSQGEQIGVLVGLGYTSLANDARVNFGDLDFYKRQCDIDDQNPALVRDDDNPLNLRDHTINDDKLAAARQQRERIKTKVAIIIDGLCTPETIMAMEGTML